MFQRPKANVLVTVLTSEVQPGLNVKSKAEFPVEVVSNDTWGLFNQYS